MEEVLLLLNTVLVPLVAVHMDTEGFLKDLGAGTVAGAVPEVDVGEIPPPLRAVAAEDIAV